jgi:predicted DNA-binding protein (MmcQ/YjbR family)
MKKHKRQASAPAKGRVDRAAADAEIHARMAADWNAGFMERLRKLCMAYPEATEVEQFGRPWWKAGDKSFCIYGGEAEKIDGVWRGHDGASFNVTPKDQARLIQDPRFKRTPYMGQHGWTTMCWTGEPDWTEVAELLDLAYHKIANKRQLKALHGEL